MKIVSTIEARMTSSRLPGKVLMPVNGRPLLYYLVKRLKSVRLIDEIVLATTTNKSDDDLVVFAESNNITVYRGSEEDVMNRVICSAESVNADIVVEITGDCPIIDPFIIDQTIKLFLNNQCEYVTNAHIRSYPDGMDTQVFYLETLKKSANLTKDFLDHEHVTLHIRNHPELFKTIHLIAPSDQFWPELGLTLDELQDYKLIKKIIEYFGTENELFTCLDTIKLLKKNPTWADTNKNVIRKGDT